MKLELPKVEIENNSLIYQHDYKDRDTVIVNKISNEGKNLPKQGIIENGFVVIQIGGKQYKVTTGDTIIVNKLYGCDVADEIVLNKVLLLGTKDLTAIGRPLLNQIQVKAQVEEQTRASKVIVFKKKRRKGYKRHRGFRAEITTLRIKEISYTDDIFN